MKKISSVYLIVYFSLLLSSPLFSQTKKIDIAYYEINKPVTISLANNKDTQAEWQFDAAENPNIQLINKRNGYLFTYFTFQIANENTQSLSFKSGTKNKEIVRSFTLKPLSSTNPPLKQEIYGDIPSLSQSDGFLSQVNNAKFPSSDQNTLEQPNQSTNVPQAEISPEKKETLDPTATKKYIQNLMDNKLYTQARNTFDELSQQPNIDANWKDLTDLRISALSGNYQELLDKTQKMLSTPNDTDTELAIRIQKAKALEKLGRIQDAEAEFLYIKSYFPDRSEVYSQLADFYIRNKQDNKALNELLYISGQFGNLQDLDKVYYQLGNAYYRVMGANGYNTALEYYKKVLGFGISSPYYKKSKQLVDFLEKNLLNYQ